MNKNTFNLSSVTFIILLLLSGCESPNGNNSANNGQFFPLAVGNKWYYNSGSSDSKFDIVWQIKGVQIIDNKNYYQLFTSILKSNTTDTSYYRYSGDTLFTRTENRDSVIADFNVRLNDSTYWSPGGIVTQKTQDSITFSASFNRVFGYSITYVRGIGMTSLEKTVEVTHMYKLVDAEIK